MGGKYLVYVSCLEFGQGFRKQWKGEKLLCFPIISGILKQNGKILIEGILSAGGGGVKQHICTYISNNCVCHSESLFTFFHSYSLKIQELKQKKKYGVLAGCQEIQQREDSFFTLWKQVSFWKLLFSFLVILPCLLSTYFCIPQIWEFQLSLLPACLCCD